MDVFIFNIPREANQWTIVREIAKVLHSPDFGVVPVEGRLVNFGVKLNNMGYKFLKHVEADHIRVNKKKLKFKKCHRRPSEKVSTALFKTLYTDPDIEEERQQKLWQLDDRIRVDRVQFGILYREHYPATDAEPLLPRSFSIEWDRSYAANVSSDSYADLKFNYDHKTMIVTLGSGLSDSTGHDIIITFSSIRFLGVGYDDGQPYVCFDTLTPPALEEIQFHRTRTGRSEVDDRKYKQRVGAINDGHHVIAPYSPYLRLVLWDDPSQDIVQKFVRMCQDAGIARSRIIHMQDSDKQIPSVKGGFFTPKRIHLLHKTLAKFEWPIAFQLEALLHNALLHTGDIDDLLPDVRELCQKHKPFYVGELLKRYNEALRMRKPRESPQQCFSRIRRHFAPSSGHDIFRCCHVTFTPTRMILEGPYATQSNRIIREYKGFEDHFLRVDFRDEDRLQYRWAREVDGASFLWSRVGGTLKNGFKLAGRDFEFLAYSNSALREHSVWFVNPFAHPKKGYITGHSIRQEVGNFTGSKLLKHPSKYAARIAQAFTATDSSVKIKRSEWSEMDDLYCANSAYLFTDGVGTISKRLATRAWEELTKDKRAAPSRVPSAFQIRFLGYKGVVAIDEQLDARGHDLMLRKSMRKFEVTEDQSHEADFEVAQAFQYHNAAYFNRPLIMILEDLGVRKEVFTELQNIAVADARTIDDSMDMFISNISSHNLGRAFHLTDLLRRLKNLNMDIKRDGKSTFIDDPFLKCLRRVAMNDILRDIKHHARIPIPNSYLLVGIADEGPAYEKDGYDNVYCLGENEIFVCIQKDDGTEPIYLEGLACISRSPVCHPGDIQRVYAIGKPPEDKLCLFSHIKNVVVMPSTGARSLASMLGGGDVDGDLFTVICHDPLMPVRMEEAADYEPVEPILLDRDSEVGDICNFVVEYILSDVLGLLSDRLITIADQSSEGIFDPACAVLAELCSQAVDYPKQGVAVNIDGDVLPRTLMRQKPDWHSAEVVSPRKIDYYESSRALGFLYRAIPLDDPEDIPQIRVQELCLEPMADPITIALLPAVQRCLGDAAFARDPSSAISNLFRRYHDELRYICSTHTLTDAAGVNLLEAEVVVGTILAKCSQKRWRSDRIYRMRLHTDTLVKEIQDAFIPTAQGASFQEFMSGLTLAWKAWNFSVRHRSSFAAHSFGLIALNTIFKCIEALPGDNMA